MHYLKGEHGPKMTIIKVFSEYLETSVIEVAKAITEIKEMDLIVLRKNLHRNKRDLSITMALQLCTLKT